MEPSNSIKPNPNVMNTTMKAVVCTQYGGPEVLQIQEISRPQPADDEVLIQIHVSSVTAADGMMRTGKPYIGRLVIGLTKPKHPITGTGFAGEAIALGKDVEEFKIGDRVFGESVLGAGTNADFCRLLFDSRIFSTCSEPLFLGRRK